MKRLIATAALLLAASPSAEAQIGAVFGTGPVSASMGSTSVHQGNPTPFSVYGAPASLGFLRDVEISAGAQYMKANIKPFGTIRLNAAGTQGEFRHAGVLDGGGQLLGLGIPIGRTRPLVIGAAFYIPFGSLIRVSGAPVNYPFYPLYNDVSRNLFFVVGAGYEIFDAFSIGVNMRSTTKSTAVYALRADNSINYSASAVEAKSETRFSFSALYDNGRKDVTRPWSLGAMYRAPSGLETKLAADISAFVPIEGAIVSTPMYVPAEWVLMGSGKLGDAVTVSADVSYVKWSAYQAPYGSGNINSLLVGANKPVAGFNDIVVPHVGTEILQTGNGTFKTVAYRFGYSFQKSPVPDQTGDTNFVDNDRHSFTTGLGLGFKNPWSDDAGAVDLRKGQRRRADLIDVDTYFQYNHLKTREVRKLASTAIGAPGYSTGGNILLFGMAATIRF